MTNQIDLNTSKGIILDSNKLYFQRIIKQVLCMFLSTIQPEYAMEFKDIRDYVLNKDATKFDNSKYYELFINNGKKNYDYYWLSSRCVIADSDDAYFDVCHVTSGNVGSDDFVLLWWR